MLVSEKPIVFNSKLIFHFFSLSKTNNCTDKIINFVNIYNIYYTIIIHYTLSPYDAYTSIKLGNNEIAFLNDNEDSYKRYGIYGIYNNIPYKWINFFIPLHDTLLKLKNVSLYAKPYSIFTKIKPNDIKNIVIITNQNKTIFDYLNYLNDINNRDIINIFQNSQNINVMIKNGLFFSYLYWTIIQQNNRDYIQCYKDIWLYFINYMKEINKDIRYIIFDDINIIEDYLDIFPIESIIIR